MALKLKLIIFFLIAIWLFGIFILPFSKIFNQLIYLYPFLANLYSNVCHQEFEKTILINKHSLLVCSRCSGIYFGAFIFSLISFFIKKKFYLHKIMLPVTLLIVIIDVLLSTLGFVNYSKTSAFATGFLLGSISFIYFYNALIELLIIKRKSN